MTVEMLVRCLHPFQFIMIVTDDIWRGYPCEVPDGLLNLFVLKLIVSDGEVHIICY